MSLNVERHLDRALDAWESQGVLIDDAGGTAPTPIERRYTPPAGAAFVGPDGETIEFLPAPDLSRGAVTLRERHPEDLAHLDGLTIEYVWKAAGGKSGGKAVLGKCTKLAGLARYLSGALDGALDGEPVDFVVWLAADHLALRSDRGIEAILFHELCHIGTDDKGNPTVVPHDWAGFAREIELFGLHTEDARTVDKAFRQLHLSGTAARE